MKKYYYADSQGQQVGPISYQQLAELHQRGLISSNTQVFEEGTADWKPYSAHGFPGATANYESVGAPPKKSGCSWPWIIAGGCFLMICLGAGIGMLGCGSAFYAISALASSITEQCKDVATHVSSNADVERELGSGLEPEFPSTYSFNTNNGVVSFVATFEVKGSKGTGTISVDREKSGGTWTYKKLTLEAGGKTYDLTGGGTGTGGDGDSTDEKGKMKLKR